IELPFFESFFGPECRVGTLPQAVAKFQKTAMLRYGNFIYAYRTLSRLRSADGLKRELGDVATEPQEMVSGFSSRSSRLVDVTPIARSETPLVGYLSAGEIVAESERVKLLIAALPSDAERAGTSWDAYQQRVLALAGPAEHRPLVSIITNYGIHFPGNT